CVFASRRIGVMSAGCPYRWTGRIARVCGPMSAAIRFGSIVSRTGSMSAKTGVAPTIMTARAVNAAESGVVMTSSPLPLPRVRKVRAIEVDRAPQALVERHRRRPAGRAPELARVRIEAADVDRFLVFRPRDAFDAAAIGDLHQLRREILQADRRVPADVEHLA